MDIKTENLSCSDTCISNDKDRYSKNLFHARFASIINSSLFWFKRLTTSTINGVWYLDTVFVLKWFRKAYNYPLKNFAQKSIHKRFLIPYLFIFIQSFGTSAAWVCFSSKRNCNEPNSESHLHRNINSVILHLDLFTYFSSQNCRVI